METRICKYKQCRLEAETQDEYCKYHKKLDEIEKQQPPWVKDMIEELRIKREKDRLTAWVPGISNDEIRPDPLKALHLNNFR